MELLPTVQPVSESAVEFTRSPLEHGVSVAVSLPEWTMTCAEAEALLTEPLRASVGESYRSAHLYEGLRAYTYSNNVLAKNIRPMEREVKQSLRRMTPDIRRLVGMLKGESGQDELILPVRVATDARASNFAREQLVTMKPSRLSNLCHDLGVPVNELALWRLKGGNRHNRTVKLWELEDLGTDSETLRHELIGRLFKRMEILSKSGVKIMLVSREDMTGPRWLQGVTVGERHRDFGVGEDQLLHWNVAFRNGAIVSRRIVPVVGWTAIGEATWSHRRIKPDFRASRMHFDEHSRCLTLYSPTIGAALISREIDLPADLSREAYEFFGRRYGCRRSGDYHTNDKLPRAAIAALPAILMRPESSRQLVSTAAFYAVEDRMIPNPGQRVGEYRLGPSSYTEAN